MQIDFQDILVGIIVVMATIYAVAKTIRQFQPDKNEPGCSKCGCAGDSASHHQKPGRTTIPKHFTK